MSSRPASRPDYYFLSEDEFSARIEAGDFIEWAQVHDHRYGTLASEVDRNLSTGQSLFLEIDVQGALAVKERFPEAVLIFIEPPSLDVLRERLLGRGSETPESLELRLHTAEGEMALRDRYDEIIVNDDLERATEELIAVLRERLLGRGSETPESLELRLHTAEGEMALRDRYDEIIVNDDLERATEELIAVLHRHERN